MKRRVLLCFCLVLVKFSFVPVARANVSFNYCPSINHKGTVILMNDTLGETVSLQEMPIAYFPRAYGGLDGYWRKHQTSIASISALYNDLKPACLFEDSLEKRRDDLSISVRVNTPTFVNHMRVLIETLKFDGGTNVNLNLVPTLENQGYAFMQAGLPQPIYDGFGEYD